MSEAVRDALVDRVKALSDCPACGAFVLDVEDFNPAVFDFVAEARFSCGAAVKVSRDGLLDVGTACPEALRVELNRIEEEVREKIEEDQAA